MFRVSSDLHLEFLETAGITNKKMSDLEKIAAVICYVEESIPPMTHDKESVLILAGDILYLKHLERHLPLFKYLSERFKKVVWVLGNHEWFTYTLKKDNLDKAFLLLESLENIHLLYDSVLELEDYSIVGSTLWSNLGKGDLYSARAVAAVSYDYKKITFLEKGNYSKLRPRHVQGLFFNHRDFIYKTLTELKDNLKPVIVVTHHAPSVDSISEEYLKNDDHVSDYGFIDFDYLNKQEIAPKFWVHGHVHESVGYYKGKTYVLCNPKGYPFAPDLNESYDPYLQFK